ncbi:adenylate/guanylate cyclase domain-containing protein [Spirochaeta africana]|uniref:Family 3 adenylate cyclase n=1 Tax=Spirochaeta africana (strain ATCC 700263 / DSM 8902 / Z-7692) TaxID=889378 RepID=H9UFK5_SPIAZ|nr:adenylate/guanylate cyclase domain-containing protein [Spirochaeta africana]AFG36298.1 family 3 adenylate cyclase [Spirochaeta africana DSM 8902]
MADWKTLLYRTNLTPQEIREIPGAACENYIAARNYLVNTKGYTDAQLLDGLEISPEEFSVGKNWLHSLDSRQFNTNVFRHAPVLYTHKEYYQAGLAYQFVENDLFLIFFRAIPVTTILREISRTARKFNNQSEMDLIDISRRTAIIKLTPYPYFHACTVGCECRFVEGVLAANFEVHKINSYTTRHVICSARIENLLRYAYGHLGLEYREDGPDIYINEQRAGRRVRLRQQEVNGQQVFSDSIDEDSVDWNAIRITAPVIVQGRELFSPGEIYNAPCCLVELAWRSPSVFDRLRHFVGSRRLLTDSLEKIEEQIEFTNLKIFKLQEALSSSMRKSAIFQVYTRSSLVREVDAGKNPLTYEPRIELKAILFCDIRDFTSLAEIMTPIDMVRFLNGYYDRMNKVITENGGEIDKLIGDCIMAVFDTADHALQAGIEARQRLFEYNRERFSYGLQKIAAGIGITYGPVVIGNIGSRSKMDFTCIGDTVNVASRIEALTKLYGVGLIISEDLVRALLQQYRMRRIDRVMVKGKQEPVQLYHVYEPLPAHVQRKLITDEATLDRLFGLYAAGRFSEATEGYRECMQAVGPHSYAAGSCADPLLPFYIRRCTDMAERTRAGLVQLQKWHGIYEFMDK